MLPRKCVFTIFFYLPTTQPIILLKKKQQQSDNRHYSYKLPEASLFVSQWILTVVSWVEVL